MDLLVRFELQDGGAELRLDRCGTSLLVEELALELHLQVLETRFGGPELQPRILERLFELGIAHLQDHGVGLDVRAGQHQDPLDTGIGARGEPPDFHRDESPRPPHLPQHRAAGNAVHPDGRPVDGRGRRLETRHPDGDDQEQDPADGVTDPLFSLPCLDDTFPLDVHYLINVNRAPDNTILAIKASCMPSSSDSITL